jgi:hypothetical protein
MKIKNEDGRNLGLHEMEQISGILNSLKGISRKIKRAININELDFKSYLQIDIAPLNHDPK